MSDGRGRSTEGFGIDRETSVNLIVKTALENGVTDPRQIAYMLATAQHETRNFAAPEEDFGRSQARKLGYGGGEDFFGRGYVHLTHKDNYAKFDRLLGLDGELVRNPALAKDPEIAAKIMVIGMRDGLFTGRKLETYIDSDSHDVYNARRVVNGVVASKPWSIAAARDCERYAGQWEQRMPQLIENVRRNGVDLAAGVDTPTRAATSVLTDGVRDSARVTELQTRLSELGYTGRDGKSLGADGHFGPNTRHAVEAFQRDHGLKVDGKAGPATLRAVEEAMRTQANAGPKAPTLADASHPDHVLYEQTREKLQQLDAERVRAGQPALFSDAKALENSAAQLVFESKVVGLRQIDSVVVRADGSGLFAVQGQVGDPAAQRVYIDKAQAIGQSVEASTKQLNDFNQQLETQQSNLAQAQVMGR